MMSSALRPTANRWQNKVFKNFRLYAVTSLEKSPSAQFLKTVEDLYRNGVDILQLRSRVLPISELLRLGSAIRKIATRMRKLYFVNDSLDLALLTGADGLHVGQEDLPPQKVRFLCRRFKKELFLGLSTHSLKQARAALTEPIDYFAVGPVFKTPTKPGYDSVGLKLVRQVSQFATKPWLAIGGIDNENLSEILDAGASRIAVVRALFNAQDPGRAGRFFSTQLKGK